MSPSKTKVDDMARSFTNTMIKVRDRKDSPERKMLNEREGKKKTIVKDVSSPMKKSNFMESALDRLKEKIKTDENSLSKASDKY